MKEYIDIYRRISLDEFAEIFGRARFLVDVFGYSFWADILEVDEIVLYDNFSYGLFYADILSLCRKILKIWYRSLSKIKEVRDYMKEVVKFDENGNLVIRSREEFRPTKKMLMFADWVVEHSGVLRNVSWDLDELARHSGVSKTLLRKWYGNPLFVRWFNEYCIKKMGFAISLLKLNIIGEALSEKASFAERKFALELVGEYTPNKGGEDKGPIQIYIFGQKIDFREKDGDNDKLSSGASSISD